MHLKKAMTIFYFFLKTNNSIKIEIKIEIEIEIKMEIKIEINSKLLLKYMI